LKEAYSWSIKDDYEYHLEKLKDGFYERIFDVKMVYNKEQKKIMVNAACKVKRRREIQIIDLKKIEENEKNDRNGPRKIIYYTNGKLDDMIVKISND
jgi:hypothetical protein